MHQALWLVARSRRACLKNKEKKSRKVAIFMSPVVGLLLCVDSDQQFGAALEQLGIIGNRPNNFCECIAVRERFGRHAL
jgi:hypothetical protein